MKVPGCSVIFDREKRVGFWVPALLVLMAVAWLMVGFHRSRRRQTPRSTRRTASPTL